MYVPAHFQPTDDDVRDLLRNLGAADLITSTADGLLATMLPLVWLESEPGSAGWGVLHGHVARNNQQWKAPSIGDAMAIVRTHVLEEIEADRVIYRRCVKIDDVVTSVPRHVIQHVTRKIAVRVDDPDAVTGGDVLRNQVQKKCRLSRATFSNAIQVLPAIPREKAEGIPVAPAFAFSHVREVCVAHTGASTRSAL